MNENRNQPPVLWTPSWEAIEAAEITRFAKWIGMESQGWDALYRYSIADVAGFWSAFWDFAGIRGEKGSRVLEASTDAPMSGAAFFPDASLNYAENMLAGNPERIALIEAGEEGVQREVTLGELRTRVAHAQAALEELGVGSGDRVAGLVGNDVDALVMVLATASLGAIWSACAPEFGAMGIVDRFGQIAPKVLVVTPVYRYNGRLHELSDRVADVVPGIQGLAHVLFTGEPTARPKTDCSVYCLGDLGQLHGDEPRYEPTSFRHPLYIIYTSGTTGLPKCIVHTAGGTLLTHRKEHMLHCDIKSGDRAFYYTNTAWMMYHWLITALASGASLVLYDGAPIPRRDDGQDFSILWRIAEETGVTHFGTSPKYLSLIEQNAYPVGRRHDLSALRVIMSAGAPLTEEQFHWVYREVKADLCLASISGGTEILGCFVMGNPVLPVRAGEIQGPALGMAISIMDDRNAPLVGKKGDLVCTEPFPSMPLTFWGEGGWERYMDTYFSDRQEIWTHGDLAEVRPSGGLSISGRTDTLLKPGGVRIGTAEVYRVVEALPEVEDSLVIGYPRGDDMELWLFVVAAEGAALNSELVERIRSRLRAEASPRHVPKRVLPVPAIPYTLNGKKVEKAVHQVVTGVEVKNKGSLVNPESLDAFVQTAEQEAS